MRFPFVLSMSAPGLILVLAAAVSRGDEAALRAPIVKELADYETHLADVRKDIIDQFELRIQRARNRGNLKEIDALSKERLRFDTQRLIPKSFPEGFRKRQESAIGRVEKLYDTTQKAATRETLDYLAEALGKEKAAFLAEVRPVLQLNHKEPTRVKAQNGWFSRDGQGMMGNKVGGVILFGGQECTETIMAHAAPRDYSEVVYQLDGTWEVFTARVGVPVPPDAPKQKKTGSKLTFEVMADKASLWRSQPSDDIDKPQSCRVDLPAEAEELLLRGHCALDSSFARLTWFDPRLSSLRFKSPPKGEEPK